MKNAQVPSNAALRLLRTPIRAATGQREFGTLQKLRHECPQSGLIHRRDVSSTHTAAARTATSTADRPPAAERSYNGSNGSPRRRPPPAQQRRTFHDYFVTHLPSTSMHPDSRSAAGPRHNLPRDDSKPDTSGSRSPASFVGSSREMTVARIPLKSAKHHFGASNVRGTRPYNEDTYQAGTIELPAFAKKPPMSVMGRRKDETISEGAERPTGDPQVFYFGVFDGHGGDKCSIWLRENLHHYLEDSAEKFEMASSLNGQVVGAKGGTKDIADSTQDGPSPPKDNGETADAGKGSSGGDAGKGSSGGDAGKGLSAEDIQRKTMEQWSSTVGGYFRRFQPQFLPTASRGTGAVLRASCVKNDQLVEGTPSARSPDADPPTASPSSLESVLTYSFLRADLDFVTATSSLTPASTDPASNLPADSEDEPALGRHTHHSSTPFLGGSTSSIALISTPNPTPFWHPSSAFTILTAHLGDTRILLSSTASGAPIPLTPTHHPSSPAEANRLRRYAATFTTDSFGEERMGGLANTRAFGDRRSKRVGVSAEPSLTLLHAAPAEFAFLVLVSDGVTGVLSDQEIVDVIKEARTPDEGARAVTALATEVGQGESGDADNATCVVVRMGGWERRSEGGGGSLGTRETRERRRAEANDPRRGRT